MPNKKKKVYVGMSGGVDSSVAAALLLKEGYEVVGVTLRLWEEKHDVPVARPDKICCSLDAVNDAKMVCAQLGIPHKMLDLQPEFRKWVVDDFIQEYLRGRTPNPCVICNIKIKWESFLTHVQAWGGGFVATGHYARVLYNERTGRYELRRGKDRWKDQSYALWGLTQESLSRTLLPLGELTKEEVRGLAEKFNLRTAQKQESQEICFIPDNDYKRFIRQEVPEAVETLSGGEIVDLQGSRLGTHRGYPFYTIGQRKGLGIAAGEPLYVAEIEPEANRIVVGRKQELFRQGLIARRVNWVALPKLERPLRAFVKIRYKDPGSFAEIHPLKEGRVRVLFEKPQRAVTPGQSVVFYEDDLVLGGGIIEESIP